MSAYCGLHVEEVKIQTEKEILVVENAFILVLVRNPFLTQKMPK